jgi:trimeric autotransporter adhesin
MATAWMDAANAQSRSGSPSSLGASNAPARTLQEAQWQAQPLTQSTAVPANSLTVTSPAIAQTPAPTPTFVVLPISARVGVGYNSPSGGTEGFGRLEGFVPLWQVPGSAIAFAEGRLLLDNGANLGANLLLGFRRYVPNQDRIWGAYVAYDQRTTEHSSFNQIGLGLESLGAIDVRVNGYIPVGQTRNNYATNLFDTGTRINNDSLRFQGNRLLYDTFRQQIENRYYEAAMAGFDAEVGGKLLALGQFGSLRGYGGFYYLTAVGSESVLGWRARLEAKPTDYLTFGLGVQGDGIFGTRAFVSVGATFPGTRGGRKPSGSETLARLGDSVGRTQQIVVDEQKETTILIEENIGLLAMNPATGDPWRFVHVILGNSTGNGTYESPFGTMTPALADAQSDGNNIVYVNPGSNPGIPGFRVPDRVQVLSTGVTQPLDVVTLGQINLPGSGTTALPLVTSTIFMGNQSVLSGFDITLPDDNLDFDPRWEGEEPFDEEDEDEQEPLDGIVADNVTGFTVRDNIVRNAYRGVYITAEGQPVTGTVTNNQVERSGNGIIAELEDAEANLTLTNNRITLPPTMINYEGWSCGICLGSFGDENSTFTIANNQINFPGSTEEEYYSSGIGIGIDSYTDDPENRETQRIITLANNRVQGAEADQYLEGVHIDSGGGINTLLVDGNQFDRLDEGIILHLDEQTLTATVTNNQIRVEGNAIRVDLGTVDSPSFTVANNQVESGGDNDAIEIALFSDSNIQTLAIRGNQVNVEGDNKDGIDVSVYDESDVQNLIIDANQVSNSEDGVYLYVDEDSTVTTSITNNQVTSQESGYLVVGSASLCIAQLSGNRSTVLDPTNYPNLEFQDNGSEDMEIRVVNFSVPLVQSSNTGFARIDGEDVVMSVANCSEP